MLAPNAWPYPQPASGGSGEPRPGLYQPLLRARCANPPSDEPADPHGGQAGGDRAQAADRGDHRPTQSQPLDTVAKDMERDYFMTAEEAKQYGIIDTLIASRIGTG